jgi:tetratricopeptide (TPR) repeat protein
VWWGGGVVFCMVMAVALVGAGRRRLGVSAVRCLGWLLREMDAKDLDATAESARKLAKRLPWGAARAGVAESGAQALWKAGRYPEAVSWAAKIVQMRREQGDRPGEALALQYLGLAYWYAGNLDEALEQLELALTLTQEVENPRREAFLKRSIGRVHEHRGEFAAARERFESSLSLFRKLGDEPEQAKLREAVARVTGLQDDGT